MPIHRLLAVVIIPLVLSLAVARARADRPKRVGVVVTLQVNMTADEANRIATAVGTAIQSEFSVDVIAGDETERRLPENGVPDECVAEVSCRNDLGRRLDADELLMLVIVRMGDDVQIDSTWANVASGDTASRPKVVLAAGDDMETTFAEAAPKLLPHIQKPEPVAPAAPAEPTIIVVPQKTDAPAARPVPLATWAAGGVSVASLVAASVFAVSARQKFAALEDDQCRDRACDPSRITSLEQRALTADILFGVSGAAAVTAAIFYFSSSSPSSKREQPPLTAQIQHGAGSFGLAVGGAF